MCMNTLQRVSSTVYILSYILGGEGEGEGGGICLISNCSSREVTRYMNRDSRVI